MSKIAVIIFGASILFTVSVGFFMMKLVNMEKMTMTIEKKLLKLGKNGMAGYYRESLGSFGTVSIAPDLFLNGEGTNIDSPEFFETDDPLGTLLLVSGKGNDTVEIWKFPFQNNQLDPLKRDSLPNGLDIDQDKDLLLIGDSGKRVVEIFSLPSLSLHSTVGKGVLDSGETNLDVLTLPDGNKRVYVSENRKIDVFDLETGEFIFSFSPKVDSIEEVLADSYHQIIYVPEENGFKSKIHSGGAIVAYNPDGKEYFKENSYMFGQGLFTGDEEGITLYACKGADGKDNGRGVIIVANQSSASKNRFEFFDRITWKYLGAVILEGVAGTDGIAVTNRSLPGYQDGIFAASNADKDVALVSWKKIIDATNIRCTD